MAVYVDPSNWKYGRMHMCHMVADTEQELHAMADAIGVDRSNYHDHHYNICKAKRELAIREGAVKITSRQAVVVRNKLRQATESPSQSG
jgi:hypothetical protein